MLAATVLSLIGMIIFGVGAWAGMNFANFYAKKAYELDLWEKCQAFQVSISPKTSVSPLD
jgi:hypothetical protein